MDKFSVVIPWRDDGTIERVNNFDWIMSRWESIFGDNVWLHVGDSGDEIFSRSKTRNLLASQSESDVIVFADADTIPNPLYITQAVEKVRESSAWCIAYGEKRYYNLTEEASLKILSMNPASVLMEPPVSWCEHRLTSWAGMIAVSRDAFKSVGGYDERFIGWGHEDVALRLKLDNECGQHTRVDGGYVMHLWHPRAEADFGSVHELRNRKIFESDYRKRYNWRDERHKR